MSSNLNTIAYNKRIRWTYLVLGVIVLLFLGLIYAWSVFRVPLENEFGWDKAQMSVTFSISMMTFCLGGLAGGIITGKKGPRFTWILCAIFLFLGFAGASRIHTLPGIYITYGCLCGFGVGLGYNTTISTIVKWFPEKQGLISGVVLTGFGFGGMLLGTLSAELITMLGWRKTFLLFAVVFALIVLACSFLIRTADESFIEAMSTGNRRSMQCLEEISWRQMLRRRSFWLCFVWAILLSAAGLAIINESTVFASRFVADDLTRAAALAGVVSVANGIGRICAGQLFDSAGYRTTMLTISALYLSATGALTLAYRSGSIPLLILAFLLVGLAYGGVPPTNSAFTAYFFGRKNYAVNFSIINMNLIVASYLGPLCGQKGFTYAFVMIAVLSVVGAVLTLSIRKSANE